MSDIRLLSSQLPDLLPMSGRSSGTHVSHVIHDLCIRTGVYEERVDAPPHNKLILGTLLEYALRSSYEQSNPGRYVVPGELELDGLYGTPDLLDTHDGAIHEIKMSWLSERHAENPDPRSNPKLWKFWVQLMAYLRMLGLDLGRLEIAFVRGDYKSEDAGYRKWECRFSRRELAENWTMLCRHRDRMEADK